MLNTLRTVAGISALSATLGCSCSFWGDCPKKCISQVETHTAGGVLFDAVSGAYPANANFAQTITTYSGDSCPETSGDVQLSFTSLLTRQAVSFNYRVVFQRNYVSWSYSSVVNRLLPGETRNIGSIQQSATILDNNTIGLLFTTPPQYSSP